MFALRRLVLITAAALTLANPAVAETASSEAQQPVVVADDAGEISEAPPNAPAAKVEDETSIAPTKSPRRAVTQPSAPPKS